ncbi:ribonuclease E inhibitor RraB [Flavobacterium panacagri]|uniref:ribonuclease E inhibitor RraB n=1 Tax=Flavobacterium panacagri TaxID=3034146 RepID=UPI0025A68E61|nr:ribonuclease E inhibitor RraB [Flavobacterium panacagri]
MSILNFLKPKKEKRLVSENDFNANLVKHYRLATESLVSLRDAAIEEEDELRIDYFFYSDSLLKAEALEKEMQNMGYVVNYGIAPHDKNIFVISGRTTEIRMMHESLSKWVAEMSEIGYKHDCSFDCWEIVTELQFK